MKKKYEELLNCQTVINIFEIAIFKKLYLDNYAPTFINNSVSRIWLIRNVDKGDLVDFFNSPFNKSIEDLVLELEELEEERLTNQLVMKSYWTFFSSNELILIILYIYKVMKTHDLNIKRFLKDLFKYKIKPCRYDMGLKELKEVIDSKEKKEIINQKQQKHRNNNTNNKIKFTQNSDYIYFDNKTDIIFIENIENIEEEITKNIKVGTSQDSYENLFFRGHSNSLFVLEPSVARSGLRIHENKMYEELLVRNSDDFQKGSIAIDVLKKMQHYNLPTRLLDVSKSMLSALYFSVEDDFGNKDDYDGEIIVFNDDKYKYGKSNTVAILATLPTLSYEEQVMISAYSLYGNKIGKENLDKELEAINRLLNKIKNEKPGFDSNIALNDLLKPLTVIPYQDNPRMIRQDAAFVICALNIFVRDDINEKRLKNKKGKNLVFIIKKDLKKSFREKLSLFGFDKSTLFPEIDDVASHIKNKYANKINL